MFIFFSEFLKNYKFSESFNNILEDSFRKVSLRQNIRVFKNLKPCRDISKFTYRHSYTKMIIASIIGLNTTGEEINALSEGH